MSSAGTAVDPPSEESERSPKKKRNGWRGWWHLGDSVEAPPQQEERPELRLGQCASQVLTRETAYNELGYTSARDQEARGPEMAGLSLVCYRGIDENGQTMPKTAESTFNSELAKVLRRKHPCWLDRIGSVRCLS